MFEILPPLWIRRSIFVFSDDLTKSG
ncbi:DUF1419 domain-containing protein [Agrobacterium pusense]